MSRSVVPVNIRPHLVPFLFNEFQGVEENYLHSKVKAAKISTRTVIGKMIRILTEKTETPIKASKYNVFLSIQDVEAGSFFGGVYKFQSGTYSFLRLPEVGSELLNEYLEDYFRLTLISFVLGYSVKHEKGDISTAINIFLDTFNLREYGFSAPTLRKIYDRESKPGARLSRLQKATSNRVLNYV